MNEQHRWITALKQHLATPEECPPPELRPDRCQFGRWLHDEAQAAYHPECLASLSRLHEQLHTLAASLLADKSQANAETLDELHAQIVALMDGLPPPVDQFSA
ncbi:MAG: CZB domain-containing protein [Pseudomonadota bacterium]